MNVEGFGIVIFIWLGLLWPFVVSIAFVASKGENITNRGRYFLLSVICGYGLAFFIGQALPVVLQATGLDDYLVEAGKRGQSLFKQIYNAALFLLIFIPQIVLSYALYKKYSE